MIKGIWVIGVIGSRGWVHAPDFSGAGSGTTLRQAQGRLRNEEGEPRRGGRVSNPPPQRDAL